VRSNDQLERPANAASKATRAQTFPKRPGRQFAYLSRAAHCLSAPAASLPSVTAPSNDC
jgi:hypothetical protein